MEMIMSAMSSTAGLRQEAVSGFVCRAAATVKRWCLAYLTWRMQEAVISHLRSKSDRELKDIGLDRSQIEVRVKGEFERSRVLDWRF
jgi:uncharacterized protein YjiS (DUF1127 family)